MSTINPVEFNVETLLKQTPNESCRIETSGYHDDAGSGESFRKHSSAVMSELEQQITAGALDPACALNLVVARTLTLVAATGAAIGLIIDQEVVCCASAGTAPDIGASIKVEEGLSGECIRSGEIVRFQDTTQDLRVDKAVCEALSMRSAMAVPIRFAGSVIGVFEVFSAEPNAFHDGAALAMSLLAEFIAGVANASMGSSKVEAVPTAAPPRPALPAESSRKPEGKLSSRSPHRWPVAVLILAALATAIVAVSYRVRDMIRSTPSAHRGAGISPPALPSPPSVAEVATPAAPVPSEPEIAREDGQIPRRDSAVGSKPVVPKRIAVAIADRRATPLPQETPTSESAVTTSALQAKPLPEREVISHAPSLAAVASGAQREAVIVPLIKVPVVDPQLAAAQVTQPAVAKPSKPRRLARLLAPLPRKLKGKQPKEHADKPKPENPGSPRPPIPQS